MTNFELKPWKKVVIHELEMLSLSLMTKYIFTGIPMGSAGPMLRWVNGYLLHVVGYVPTEKIVNAEIEKGITHFRYVALAKMDQYAATIEAQGNRIIPVIDVSSNAIYAEMIEWAVAKFGGEKQCVCSVK